MIKRIQNQKLRTKMLLLLLAAAVLSILLFAFLWNLQPHFWKMVGRIPGFDLNQEAFEKTLQEEAGKYTLPETGSTEQDAEEQLKGFLDLADAYTGMAVYDEESGWYICSTYPSIMDQLVFGSLIDVGYRMTRGKGETFFQTAVSFQNKDALINITSYHASRVVYPYFFFCLAASILFFLFCILAFIRRKMDAVLQIKEEVLRMASGDLTHSLPDFGEDEIGILSEELDHLRLTLDEQIRQETASRQANQDLITTMSHDLRTPLTILRGYLEVLQLKKAPPAMQEEYLERCLQKTDDIKNMTDKMFEYALIYEETEQIDPVPIKIDFLAQCLNDNCDFLQLAGFTVQLSLAETDAYLLGDNIILKRIFHNLFSNILKYGDKRKPVQIVSEMDAQTFKVTIQNGIRQDTANIESNRIGLQSAEKMAELHKGSLYVFQGEDTYSAVLRLPAEQI